MSNTHLIIPDPHASPDEDLSRFSYLGKFIASVKPDAVICIGDWADMPSLCSYDKGTKGFEGRRYKKDIEAAILAQEMMFKPIRQAKKRLPRFIMTTGNHDYGRLTRLSRKMLSWMELSPLKIYNMKTLGGRLILFWNLLKWTVYITRTISQRGSWVELQAVNVQRIPSLLNSSPPVPKVTLTLEISARGLDLTDEDFWALS